MAGEVELTTAKRMEQNFENKRALRQGVIDVEIAKPNTDYKTATGWERLGTIEPNSYKLSAERTKYTVERGFPQATKYAAIIGQKGTVGFTLDEVSARGYELANGGNKTEYTVDAATTTTVATATDNQTFTVAALGTIKAGDFILHTRTGGDKYMREVEAVTADTKTIKLVGHLPFTPVATEAISKVTETFNVIGGDTLEEFALRAVVVDNRGNKEILYFPNVSSAGKLEPTYDPAKHFQIPLNFDLYGSEATINGDTEYVLGEIHTIYG